MKHAKRILILTLVLALCVCTVSASADGYGLGEPMEDFSVTTITGDTFTLSEVLAEKGLVLINLWATWCGPCQMEFPYLEEAYEMYSDRVEVIALSVEPTDTDEVLTDFAAEYGLTFPIANEGDLGLGNTYANEGIPTSLIVDRFGNLAFREVGSQPSADAFTRVFDYFLSEDYTETAVLEGVPASTPSVPIPDAAELAAALSAEDSGITFRCADDETVWPMIPTEKDGRSALVNSNSGNTESTAAALYADVTAAEGDVLAVDVACSTVPMWNMLSVSVDGSFTKGFSGERDFTTWAVPLEAGQHEIVFVYRALDWPGEDEDSVWLSDMRILSGTEAEEVLAALPSYPTADELSLTILNEDVQEIFFTGTDSTALMNLYDFDRAYIVNDSSVDVEGDLAAGMDAESAFFYSNYDGSLLLLSDALNEDGVYTFSSPLDDLKTSGYSYTGVSLYSSIFAELPSETIGLLLFSDEENANAFAEEARSYDELDVDWVYADEADPSAGTQADDPDEAAEAGVYEVLFTDQNGDPVPGCIINFCTDESCTPVTSDENGLAVFTGEPYAYHLQVIKVPEGYSFDTAQEFYTEETGGELSFTVTKN